MVQDGLLLPSLLPQRQVADRLSFLQKLRTSIQKHREGLLCNRNVQYQNPAVNIRIIMQHHLFPMASDYAISEQKNAKPWKNTVAFQQIQKYLIQDRGSIYVCSAENMQLCKLLISQTVLCKVGQQVKQESISLSLKSAEEVSLNTGEGGLALCLPCSQR